MGAPDLSEFVSLSKPKKRPCAVGVALGVLDKNEREQLKAAFAADPMVITAGAIRDWLERRGHEASIAGITYHRSGRCTCNA